MYNNLELKNGMYIQHTNYRLEKFTSLKIEFHHFVQTVKKVIFSLGGVMAITSASGTEDPGVQFSPGFRTSYIALLLFVN
jgi:hypothetical protein